jgi:hypothetical protein
MAFTLSTTIRGIMAAQILNAIDDDTGGGYLEIYTGTMPADLGAVTDQTLLGTLTFSDPCGTVSGDTLTFDSITADSAADASGTAAWCRLYAASGAVVGDGDVGTSGKFLNMNTTTIVAGGPIEITSMTIAVG